MEHTKIDIKLPRTLSGIEPFTGKMDSRLASHLLRRTTFAPTIPLINSYSSITIDQAVKKILTPQTQPQPPLDPSNGAGWVDQPFNTTNNGKYMRYVKDWWLGLCIASNDSIHEKMTLFWHNHFVSEAATVEDARYMYYQNSLIRQYALGNIKEFVKAITKDPAMLRYLNGNTNIAGKPNENYARELQELFTIGKGAEIAPGNYTNYTENDVQEAAKVLTGWKDSKDKVTTSFVLTAHDKTDKQFSPAYQNTVIKGRNTATAGDDELNDLVNMIFKQSETAKSFCRKIYRWFVYYDIDQAAETNVIEPLSEILINNDYEILPVLIALFSSSHFFDEVNIGCQIKNPIDFYVQSLKFFNVPLPDPVVKLTDYYSLLDKIVLSGQAVNMNLLDPPNVAGWPAYYQQPSYYQLWINTLTLPLRNSFTDSILINGKGFNSSFVFDSTVFVKTNIKSANDAKGLITELSNILFVNPLTSQQIDYLVNQVLLNGLPDYEWTTEWNDFINNPTDKNKKATVKLRLDSLFKFILRLAEYQLN